MEPNLDVINDAVSVVCSSPDCVTGFCLDFGVTKCGETLLIEMNDGFSLGAYGLHPSLYADLIISRWEELVTAT